MLPVETSSPFTKIIAVNPEVFLARNEVSRVTIGVGTKLSLPTPHHYSCNRYEHPRSKIVREKMNAHSPLSGAIAILNNW